MISILASLAGFISSFLPMLISTIKEVYSNKHEINLMDKKIEMCKMGFYEPSKISNNIEAKLDDALYNTFYNGIYIVDLLNGCVRPLIATSFFAVYCYVKYISFNTNQINAIWDDEDQAIFATIISFYYGQRSWKNHIHTKGK